MKQITKLIVLLFAISFMSKQCFDPEEDKPGQSVDISNMSRQSVIVGSNAELNRDSYEMGIGVKDLYRYRTGYGVYTSPQISPNKTSGFFIPWDYFATHDSIEFLLVKDSTMRAHTIEELIVGNLYDCRAVLSREQFQRLGYKILYTGLEQYDTIWKANLATHPNTTKHE